MEQQAHVREAPKPAASTQPPVRNEDTACRPPKDAAEPQYEDGRKLSAGGVNISLQEKRIPSEGSTRKTRKKPRNQGYGTPETDVIVPPFADWEKNPESADKYTGVFQLISDSRKTPGTPGKWPVQPDTDKKDNTECKGCGCFSWPSK